VKARTVNSALLTIFCLVAGLGYFVRPAEVLAQRFSGPGKSPWSNASREKMDLVLKWKLVEALDLNETQSERFFPLYTKLRKSREEFMRKRESLVDKLRDSLDNAADDAELKKLIEKIEKMDTDFYRERQKYRENLREILTTKQWAQYIIFETEFPRRIMRFLRERNRRFKQDEKW